VQRLPLRPSAPSHTGLIVQSRHPFQAAAAANPRIDNIILDALTVRKDLCSDRLRQKNKRLASNEPLLEDSHLCPENGVDGGCELPVTYTLTRFSKSRACESQLSAHFTLSFDHHHLRKCMFPSPYGLCCSIPHCSFSIDPFSAFWYNESISQLKGVEP
jgi:hypothetical protein